MLLLVVSEFGQVGMGKVVANFFISLDGVVESPDKWHFPYFNDQMGAAVGSGMETSEAFLLGRKGYDEWSAYWPQQGPDVPFSEFINTIPKYVVSNSLQHAEWEGTTIIPGDKAVEQIQELKEKTKGSIAMSGSATLVRWLLANNLLDELNLLVHPVVVGSGQRLFEDTPTYPLKLVTSETFTTGVLNLSYAPAA